MAEIVTMTGADRATPLALAPQQMKEGLKDLSAILREVAEAIVQPAFARNYDRSGLKTHAGVLKTAVAKTGARGNLLEIGPHSLSAGVDYVALPYARYALEGRGPVAARNRKALRFVDASGKTVFVKSVRASPAHDVIYLTAADYAEIETFVAEKLVALGALVIKSS